MSPKVSAEYMLQRRKKILDAATKVFSEKGFNAATLDDIATAAEVSKGSIYNHFDSKEAMIDGLSQRWHTTDDEVLDAAEAMPRAINGVTHIVKATIRRSQRVDFGDSARLGMFVWAEVLINPAVAKNQARLCEQSSRRFSDLVNQAKMEGDIGPAFTVDSVVMFLGSLGGGFFLSRVWGTKSDVTDAEKLVDAFISNLS
jgi:TetR/AcrR family transcriptional repressor of uid operon